MSPDEVIIELTRVRRTPPVEALRAADVLRLELTPRLLACLREAVDRPDRLADDEELQLPFYAMYVLAAWREPLTHPLLLAFLRLPGEQCLDLSGDIITEDMHRMLAQTAGGNVDGLVALARDPVVNEWARGAAIDALALLDAWGELPRETLIAHYRDLIASVGPPQSVDNPDTTLSLIVSAALDVRLTEMRGELLVLMDRGWVDQSLVGSRDEVSTEFERPVDRTFARPIDDVAEAIRWWGCFERERPFPSLPLVPLAEPDRPGMSPKPYHAPPKIGRNDPCPCGSGKKHKKCCGA